MNLDEFVFWRRRNAIKESAILSMAQPWNVIKERIRAHLPVMVEHLVKIYYYHDYAQYLHGWVLSVRKGFEIVPKDSRTNKYVSKEKFYDYIWNDEFTGDPDGFHKSVIEDLNSAYEDVPHIKPEDIRLEGFRDFMSSYLILLASSIEEQGTISVEKIMEFMQSYEYGFSLK